MLLYIHVPFCRAKCRYCAFHSVPLAQGAMDAYLDLTRREMRHWGERLGRPEVETVYIGGGTPSLIPIPDLASLLAVMRESFRLKPGGEFTFEAVGRTGDGNRADGPPVGMHHRDADRAQAVDVLLVVERVSAFADAVQFVEKFPPVRDGILRPFWELVVVEEGVDLVVRHMCEDDFAGRRGVYGHSHPES